MCLDYGFTTTCRDGRSGRTTRAVALCHMPYQLVAAGRNGSFLHYCYTHHRIYRYPPSAHLRPPPLRHTRLPVLWRHGYRALPSGSSDFPLLPVLDAVRPLCTLDTTTLHLLYLCDHSLAFLRRLDMTHLPTPATTCRTLPSPARHRSTWNHRPPGSAQRCTHFFSETAFFGGGPTCRRTTHLGVVNCSWAPDCHPTWTRRYLTFAVSLRLDTRGLQNLRTFHH